jgi:hypothetical protein
MSVDLSKSTYSSSVAESELLANGGAPAEATAKNHSSKEIDAKERHLSTDHLLTDLKGRTISGAFITIAAQGAQFVLSLASIMVLARLLTPKDFGLFAMVTSVIGYLRVFKDAGLSTATVPAGRHYPRPGLQSFLDKRRGERRHKSDLCSWFPDYCLVLSRAASDSDYLVLSSTFLLSGLTIQHTALLNRQMRFKAVAVIQVSSLLIGVAVGIGMAWLGYNYWALVFSNLITLLLRFR